MEAESDADGSFVLGGLKEGAHFITAYAAGFARVTAQADAGGDPIELVMDAGGAIEGRLVGAKGQPVDGATVWAEDTDASLRRSSGWLHGNDARGRRSG